MKELSFNEGLEIILLKAVNKYESSNDVSISIEDILRQLINFHHEGMLKKVIKYREWVKVFGAERYFFKNIDFKENPKYKLRHLQKVVEKELSVNFHLDSFNKYGAKLEMENEVIPFTSFALEIYDKIKATILNRFYEFDILFEKINLQKRDYIEKKNRLWQNKKEEDASKYRLLELKKTDVLRSNCLSFLLIQTQPLIIKFE